MSTYQKVIGAAQEAARIASRPAGAGIAASAPMYISEVAPARLRGRLASLQQLAIVLGLWERSV